ncbi:MAG: zf-HC2 domain-containing protein [Balneolaceae bacterium]|nr:zf-HC2 domain-containing protein [Balneolaceae bacterium]
MPNRKVTRMIPNNKHVKTYFLDWWEGQLDTKNKRAVEQHLQTCETCHSYFQAMQSVLEDPRPELLPTLQKDPYLPVRIKRRAEDPDRAATVPEASFFGLSKLLTCSLVVLGLLLGFVIGQQLVYISQSDLQANQNTSISELYYEGMVQPNLGSQFEVVLTEMEGGQQ